MFPILLILLMGIFDLGRAVFAYNSVTNAAREGARLAIVNQDKPLVRQRAISQAALAVSPTSASTSCESAPLTCVQVNYYETTTDTDVLPASPVPCGQLSLECVASVTFKTTYRPITPIISNLLFPAGVTFTATSVEQLEYLCPNAAIPAASDCPRQPNP